MGTPNETDENSLEEWQKAAAKYPAPANAPNDPGVRSSGETYQEADKNLPKTETRINDRGYAEPVPPKPANVAAAGGDIVRVDPYNGPAPIAPQVVPEHEVALVNPKRQAAEQETYRAQRRAVGKQGEAVDEQKSAEDQVAAAQADVNKAKSVGENYLSALAAKQQSDVESKSSADKEKRDAFRAKLDAYSADIANDRVQAPVGRNITWTIARALGAIGQGFLHTSTNQVADQINDYIKQELEVQRENRKVKRERVNDLKTYYDLAAGDSKDEAERMTKAHAYALEAAKHQVQSLADVANNSLAMAKAAQIKALLSEKQGQLGEKDAQIQTTAVQRGIAENKWVPAGVSGGKPVDSKHVFYDPVTGQHYAAKDEKSRGKLTESGAAVLDVKDAAQKYANALEKLNHGDRVAGKVGYTTDDLSEAQTAYNHVLGIVRKAQNDGVWKKSEAEMLAGTLTPPEHFTGNPQKQLALINSTVNIAHKSAMTVEAPDPVVAAPQPAGTAPKNIPTGQNYKAPKPPPVKSMVTAEEAVKAKARGGDVDNNQPYLVGEKGPELVVPNKPGFVLTALQTAALKGAPPTEQQMATLPPGAKSAIQRFAEKMGVAREEGGPVGWQPSDPLGGARPAAPPARPAPAPAPGARRQPTPEELAADEETMRRFFGPDHEQAKFVAPQTEEEAQDQMREEAYQRREAERDARLREEAERARQQELQARQRREAEAREVAEMGPVRAWVNRTSRSIGENMSGEDRQSLYGVADRLKSAADKMRSVGEVITPKSWQLSKDEVAQRAAQHEPDFVRRKLAEGAASLPRRSPVQFERHDPEAFGPPPPPARADGGEVLPLYEPEGQQLHQSMDGHAYLAANDAPATDSRPSLSGPTPRYSSHPLMASSSSAPARREKTPEELMREADAMKSRNEAEYKASLARGPAVHEGPPKWLEDYMRKESAVYKDRDPLYRQGDGKDYYDQDPLYRRANGGAMQPKGLASSIARDLRKTKRAC